MADSRAWDERYRRGEHADGSPDPFLAAASDLWGPGRAALDVACGAGHNARFLAESGFSVTALDWSEEALRLTSERCADLDVRTERADLEAEGAGLGDERYDIVCVVRFLHRPLFAALRQAVKPGGLVVYRTFTTHRLEASSAGPRDPRFLLEPGELPGLFPGWRVLRYEEESDGPCLAGLVARKPDSPPPSGPHAARPRTD
jgi:tellurite methyltransferase